MNIQLAFDVQDPTHFTHIDFLARHDGEIRMEDEQAWFISLRFRLMEIFIPVIKILQTPGKTAIFILSA